MQGGGSNMMNKHGGFKKVVLKAFPEADFSQWSKNPSTLALLS